MADDRVRLEIDGPIAMITNDNPEKHNAFDDEMDSRLFEILGRAQGPPRRAGGHLAGRGQVVLVGSRRAARSAAGEVELTPPRADDAGATAGIQQIFDLDAPIIVAMQGLGDRRVVPAGAAVRHPHRRRGRPVHAPRGHLRRDPRHRRGRPPVPDLRSRRGQRHGAHRAADGGRRGARATASCRGSCPPTSSTPPCARWPRRSPPRPAVTVKMARRVIRAPGRAGDPLVDGRRADLPDVHQQVRRLRRDARRPRGGSGAGVRRELTGAHRASRMRLRLARSLRLARRTDGAITGPASLEKPAGSPRLRSVMRVERSASLVHV